MNMSKDTTLTKDITFIADLALTKDLIIPLADERARDIQQTGGKGSALALLLAEHFPVPGGFVIATAAFSLFCEQHQLLERVDAIVDQSGGDASQLQTCMEQLQQEIRTLALPNALLSALAPQFDTTSRQHGSGRWAVRSSAVAEDLQGASFAGQYDTVLGVGTHDELYTAIRHCWASFFNGHAMQYKKRRQITDHRFAVVVQQLIPAEAAGVAFSINPVNGNLREIIINANVGLGESIVSGLVTPDTFIVEKTPAAEAPACLVRKDLGSKRLKTLGFGGAAQHIDTSAEEQQRYSLTDQQIRDVARLTQRVEEARQFPVDIEWALLEDKIWLLQARPITASATVAAAPDDGNLPPEHWVPAYNTPIDPAFPLHTNGNISEILPGCITPLTWSRIGPTIDYAFTRQYYEMGLVPDKPDPTKRLRALAFFYYRPYLCISYFTEVAKNTPGLTPDIYLEEFVGRPDKPTPPFHWRDLHPRQTYKLLRMIIALIVHAINNDKAVAASQAYITRLLAQLSDDAIAHTDSNTLMERVSFSETYGRLSLVHIWASSFASLGFAIIRGLAKKWLGETTDTLAASLVTGIGVLPSAEPAFGIHDLATRITRDSSLAALFDDPDNQRVYDALRCRQDSAAQQFNHALDDFLGQHGHRGICEAELMTLCWRDQPAQVIALVRNFMQPHAQSPAIIRQRQEQARLRATDTAMSRLPLLQRKLFSQCLRFTKHFIHQREALKNMITLREDRARMVFRELARRLVRDGKLQNAEQIYFLTSDNVRDLLRGRLSAPAAQALLNERQQDFEWSRKIHLAKIIRGQARPVSAQDIDASRQFTGIGVYPGKIEGKARVILDPRTDAAIQPGEILIAPVTDAGWTPLFINAAALVVDVGGLLSHGSVVAREYGLPAVVGAEGATQRIRTGDRLLVDGGSGIVMILD